MRNDDKPKVGDLVLLGKNLVGIIVGVIYMNMERYYRIQWNDGDKTWTAMYGEREVRKLISHLKKLTENDSK
mgnify:CR=1 FL=1